MSKRCLKHHVLVVDDEAIIRESLSTLFLSKGYKVSTAEDGFDALLQLRKTTPDLITSDLNMPNMSGFEFLSVIRRRFPQIPVVAISGAYECGEAIPGGIIADGFYAKGQHHPEALLATVADLIRTSGARAIAHQQQSAPVWIPLLLAQFGKEGKPEKVIPTISQETLADMIGTTRSRVSFFMNRFRKLGFIKYNGSIEVHSSLLNVILHD